MNTFFQKKPQRRWTWKSPGGTARNEIDYILSSSKDICTDVSVGKGVLPNQNKSRKEEINVETPAIR